MSKRFNITTDESRIPHEVEAQDGFYCHAADMVELERQVAKADETIKQLVNTINAFYADPDA